MAREAGLAYGSDEKPLGSVIRFAALVASAEREACAQIIDDSYNTTEPGQGIPEDWLLTLSEQIRARGNVTKGKENHA